MKQREQSLLLLRKAAQLTPFAAVYRYEDFDSELTLDRERARSTLRLLRAWVEERLGVIGPSGDSVIG